MKPTANVGAEKPFAAAEERITGAGQAGEDKPAADHDPDATALLRRYLSEVHSFREMGNQALRNLEARLALLGSQDAAAAMEVPALSLGSAKEAASEAAVPSPDAGRATDASLTQRLSELSAYLHADLARENAVRRHDAPPPLPSASAPRKESPAPAAEQPAVATGPSPHAAAPHQVARILLREPQQPIRPASQAPAQSPRPQPQAATQQAKAEPRAVPQPQPEAIQRANPQHKSPNLPVLDRAWFEERFAAMRASIDQMAAEVPLRRIEALEEQFRGLMERLTAREESRDRRPMEASLRELAAYLGDSRQWQAAQDQRMKGVEDRLDRISHLVARSNAAISATANGLETIAKGTGDTLARATAGIVIANLGAKIERANPVARLDALGAQVAQLAQSNPSQRLEQLGREVAHLTAQSRMISRSTEDRLGQIEIMLKEKSRPAPAPAAAPALAPVPSSGRAGPDAAKARASRDELDSYLNSPTDPEDDYDSEMIAAAQCAARLADGPSRNAPARTSAARYQFPYGEFLPEDESPASRSGLIIAVVILLLAGAVMLFLKAKEWTLSEPRPAAMQEGRRAQPAAVTARQDRQAAPERTTALHAAEGAAAQQAGVPVVTGSTPSAPPLNAKPLQLWVSAKAPDAAPATSPVRQPLATISFRQAAVQGDVNAQFSVGQSYLSGTDADASLSEGERLSAGVRWFRRAGEAGHAPSQYRLGKLYELGRGAPLDLAEAEAWYERAADQGHVHAMHSLAMLAASRNRRTTNYLTAAKWFAMAAGYGLLESQFNLGMLYEHGLGVQRSAIEAYFWFTLAARQRDAKAAQKRDEMAGLLTSAERLGADRRADSWAPRSRIEEVNRIAPEPPVAAQRQDKPAASHPVPAPAPTAETPSAAVMRANWKTDVAPMLKTSGTLAMVQEAQRLLKQRGYDPGPIDGKSGPRTEAAIRSFQRRAGLDETGIVSEALIVKMAFLPL